MRTIWKVNVTTKEQYRAVTKELNNRSEIYWHTHENKNTRDLIVISKRVSPLTPEEDILKSLKDEGFKIVSGNNIVKKV